MDDRQQRQLDRMLAYPVGVRSVPIAEEAVMPGDFHVDAEDWRRERFLAEENRRDIDKLRECMSNINDRLDEGRDERKEIGQQMHKILEKLNNGLSSDMAETKAAILRLEQRFLDVPTRQETGDIAGRVAERVVSTRSGEAVVPIIERIAGQMIKDAIGGLTKRVTWILGTVSVAVTLLLTIPRLIEFIRSVT